MSMKMTNNWQICYNKLYYGSYEYETKENIAKDLTTLETELNSCDIAVYEYQELANTIFKAICFLNDCKYDFENGGHVNCGECLAETEINSCKQELKNAKKLAEYISSMFNNRKATISNVRTQLYNIYLLKNK